MTAAIKSGILNNHKPSDVASNCPTSHFTWQQFTTLAVCSSVEDIYSTIVGVDHDRAASTPIYSVQALQNINRKPPIEYDDEHIAIWVETLAFGGLQDSLATTNETNPSMADF